MSTVGRKRREARKQRYETLMLALRLKGVNMFFMDQYKRSHPNTNDIRWLQSIVRNTK